MATAAELLKALEDRVKGEELELRYHVWIGEPEELKGGYETYEGFPPRIEIWRLRGEHGSDDPLFDLHTLAHEYGHHLSAQQGNRTSEYVALLTRTDEWPQLPERAKLLIFTEEVRAWGFARTVLSDLGHTEWLTFVNRVFDGLEAYKRMLDLPPSGPSRATA